MQLTNIIFNTTKGALAKWFFPIVTLVITYLTIPFWEIRQHWAILFVFSILTIVASFAPIRTLNASLTLNNSIILTGIVLEGTWVAVWCALLESLTLAFLLKAPINKTLANAGQALATIWIVSELHYWLQVLSVPWMLSDLILIAIYLAANTCLCAILISYYMKKTWLETTKHMIKSGSTTYIMLLIIGSIGARLIDAYGILALIPLTGAFVTISVVLHQYYDGLNKLEQKVEEVKSFNQKFLTAMAASIEARDRYTSGHSQRVAHWGREIALGLGLPKEKVDQVYFGGILHDIGKIGIEDEILNKEGKLTPEEYDKIKQHTVIGYEIVQQVELFPELLPAIRWHHERIDGRGYPDGLSGDQIPLVARILAVSDAFDAMVADRPYRKGLPVDAALQEIKQGAGTQFDAILASNFIEIINRLPRKELEEFIRQDKEDTPHRPLQEAFS